MANSRRKAAVQEKGRGFGGSSEGVGGLLPARIRCPWLRPLAAQAEEVKVSCSACLEGSRADLVGHSVKATVSQ